MYFNREKMALNLSTSNICRVVSTKMLNYILKCTNKKCHGRRLPAVKFPIIYLT